MSTKQQLMQQFLDKNYYTLAELAKICATTEQEILNLENNQCIPGHTYEARQSAILTCAGIDNIFSEYTSLKTILYYHNSITSWVNDAIYAVKTASYRDYTLTVKDNFLTQVNKALNGISTPDCQSPEQAWTYWIDGTWGKCLKQLSVACLAKKELARYRIAELMHHTLNTINDKEKQNLHLAVETYIASSLDFDTYGLRYCLAEEAINKFDLAIRIDKKYLV